MAFRVDEMDLDLLDEPVRMGRGGGGGRKKERKVSTLTNTFKAADMARTHAQKRLAKAQHNIEVALR